MVVALYYPVRNLNQTTLGKTHHILYEKNKDQVSRDRPFLEKTIVFRDRKDNQEHDAKVRLSIPSPSSEKLKAEII